MINTVAVGIQHIGAVDQPRNFNATRLGNDSEPITYQKSRRIKQGILSSDIRNPGTAAFTGEHTIVTKSRVVARIGVWLPSYQPSKPTNYQSPNPWSSAIDVRS